MEGQIFMLSCSLLLFVLMALNNGNILFINAKDVYYITDGLKTVEKECYKCPAGREPVHECWKSYTKEENSAMLRACQVCKPGFYKELPDDEYSYEKCRPCILCFEFIVTQECDPRHGRVCGNTCIEDYYLMVGRCRKCCKCTEGDKKEEGCKSSTSRKFCGSESNGECKAKVQSLPLRSVQPSSTRSTQTTKRSSKISSSTTRPMVTISAYSFHATSLKTKEMSTQGTLSTSYSTVFSQRKLESTKVTTTLATKIHTEPSPRLTQLATHTVMVKVSSRSLMSSTLLPYNTSLPKPRTPSPRISNGLSGIAIACIVGGLVIFIIICIGIARMVKRYGKKCCIGGVKDGSRHEGESSAGTNDTGGGGAGPSHAGGHEMAPFLPSPNGELSAASEQPLLSKLREDYNLVQRLESKLEGTSINNFKDLLRAFDLPLEDRSKILKCATQSIAFFENLSKSKPHLKLRQLRTFIQDTSLDSKPNMAIFVKVEEDIANVTVEFTLDATLGEISNNPKDWLYILEEVACKLVPEEGTRLISWENIAGLCGYKTSEISAFQRKNTEETPLRKLLSLLCAKDPPPTVSLFVDKLRRIGRNDVAKIVEEWLDGLVDEES